MWSANLLCVCAAALLVAALEAAQCTPSTEPGFQCTKCNIASFCEGEVSSFDVTCDADQTEVCSLEVEGVPCQDPTTKLITECGCVDPDTGDSVTGTFRDPYDLSAFFTCTSQDQSFGECQSDEMYSESRSNCMPAPSCTGNNGKYPVMGECNAFMNCTSDPISGIQTQVEFCERGEIFDFFQQDCVERFSCAAAVGEFQDAHKCNLFYSCFSSETARDTAHCCKPGQVYESRSHQCVDKGTGCDSRGFNPCIEEMYENDYCRTCEGERIGYIYETWELCTSNYWECQLVDGEMRSVLKQCEEETFYDGEQQWCAVECPNAG